MTTGAHHHGLLMINAGKLLLKTAHRYQIKERKRASKIN